MPKAKIPSNEELTEEQRAWRDEHDQSHLLNINQIMHRLERVKREAYNREIARETRKKERTISTDDIQSGAEDSGHPGSKKLSIEQYLEIANGISDRADVNDLMKILHANMVVASQNMDLRPQDFITAIRMLREIQKEDTPVVIPDPYNIEPMTDAEVCDLFIESITAHVQHWRRRKNEQRALWLIPFFEQLFTVIFTDAPFEGLLVSVSESVDRYYSDVAVRA